MTFLVIFMIFFGYLLDIFYDEFWDVYGKFSDFLCHFWDLTLPFWGFFDDFRFTPIELHLESM